MFMQHLLLVKANIETVDKNNQIIIIGSNEPESPDSKKTTNRSLVRSLWGILLTLISFAAVACAVFFGFFIILIVLAVVVVIGLPVGLYYYFKVKRFLRKAVSQANANCNTDERSRYRAHDDEGEIIDVDYEIEEEEK